MSMGLWDDAPPLRDSRTSRESQLKTWIVGDTFVTPLGTSNRKFKVAEMVCPQRDCGKLHIVVVRDWWKAPHKAAPCPYCFATAWRGAKP